MHRVAHRRKLVVVFLVAIGTVLLYFGISNPGQPSSGKIGAALVVLGDTRVFVEIADEPAGQMRGLSGRTALEPGWGMLFVFSHPGIYSFWMKDMLFSLDIIWIDQNQMIVHVVSDASPCPESGLCMPYVPQTEALYVLEVPAGFVRTNRITLGMRAEIHLTG